MATSFFGEPASDAASLANAAYSDAVTGITLGGGWSILTRLAGVNIDPSGFYFQAGQFTKVFAFAATRGDTLAISIRGSSALNPSFGSPGNLSFLLQDLFAAANHAQEHYSLLQPFIKAAIS